MYRLNPAARDGGRTSSCGYDIWGEHTEREDVIDGQTGDYTYSPASRLTQAKLTTGKVTLSANYDAAGRIESGAGYTVTYDRRGLTATIAHGSDTASLAYAPDGERYAMTVDGETTVYLAGGAFRVVQNSSGTTGYRQAIVAGGVMVAQWVTRSDGSSDFEYFYHDGLGSPEAFGSASGAEVFPRLSYGPFGRVRDAAAWQTLDAGYVPAAHYTRRGYTGGEQLTKMGVVILGARVYVPPLGRWLSPDPAGAGSPYVYAGDNPETDIDPTGAIDWNSVGKVFEAAAIAVVSFYTAGAVDAVYGPVAGGAAGGFVGGFAGSGGNLEDGAIGALGGAAMGYFGDVAFGGANATAGQLAERATVEGVVGGTLSAAVEHGRGGSFESGFLGAFAAALIGGGIEPASTSGEVIAARTAAMSVVGGTVAEIGGESFANGAISAAFQQLFNQGLRAEQRAAAYKRMLAKYGPVLAVLHAHGVTLSREALIAGNISNSTFIKYVRTSGKWDYKHSRWFAHFKKKALLESFGNFNYGFLAHAHGWSLGLAVMGAGLYQLHSGYSSFAYTVEGYSNLAYSSLTVNIASFLSNDGYAAYEINYRGVRFGDNPGDSRKIEAGYNF